jgi:hypothetical protein
VPAGNTTEETLIEQEIFPFILLLYKSSDLLPGSCTLKGGSSLTEPIQFLKKAFTSP